MSAILSAIDVDEVTLKHEISINWGFILAGGVVNVIGGILALCSPAAASLVVVGFFSCAMIVVGSINLLGVCYAENCSRIASFLNGSILVLLGVLMLSNAVTSLFVLTSLVAALFMAEGLFRTILAMNNREMPGWGWHLANGICSILFSIAVVVALPASEAVTLGILLGCNWLTFGLQRVAIGFIGRTISNEALQGPGEYSRVPY